MRVLNQETRNIQNPAIGAALLWRFSVGYARGSKTEEPTPLPLLFIVLPMLFHQDTTNMITSTLESSGLRVFSNKFSAPSVSKNDLLFAINKRVLEMRPLSLDALCLAITSNLLSLDYRSATVFPLTHSPHVKEVSPTVVKMLKSAERLGFWCSLISLHEISVILKIGF